MQTITETIHDGPIPLGLLVVVGSAAALGAAVMIVWETWRVGRGLSVLLASLRAGVVAAVVWMLAGLAVRTETRNVQPASLAVLADVSASMSVVDPGPPSGPDPRDVRWAGGRVDPAIRSFWTALDGAAVQAAWVGRCMERLNDEATNASSPAGHYAMLDRVAARLRSAAGRLEEAVRAAPVHDEVLARRLEGIRAVWLDDLLPSLYALQPAVEASHETHRVAWRAAVAGIRRKVAAHAAELTRICDEWTRRIIREATPAGVRRMQAWAAPTRAGKVAAWLKDARSGWLGEVATRADIACYTFASHVRSIPFERLTRALDVPFDEGAMKTDLAGALRLAVAEAGRERLRGVILLTDGAHNAGPDPVQAAAGLAGIPVLVVPVGWTEPPRDVVLHHARAPATVFKGDAIVVEAILDAYDLARRPLTVELRREGRVLAVRQVIPDADRCTVRIRFQDRAERTGILHYQLHVRSVPGECVEDNNKARVDVHVVEGRIKLLLVDQLPRWDFRYLRNLFKRDPRVDAETVLLTHLDDSPSRAGVGLPETPDQWRPYHAVILGDIGPEVLDDTRQAAIETYVRQGGTLILIAGPDAMPAAYRGRPLESLLPVEPQAIPACGPEGFALELTAEGRETPVTQLEDDPAASARIWREQVSVYEPSAWSKPKPAAHVLLACVPRDARPATTQPPAFLCWQFVGRGRVVYLSAPALYQLRRRFGDRYHHRFWGQLLRWAVARELAGGTRTVRLTTDKQRYTQDQPVRVRVELADLEATPVGGANVTVVASQDRRPIGRIVLQEEPGRTGSYDGWLGPLPVGSVTLTAEGPQVADLLRAEGVTGPVRCSVQIEPTSRQELRETRCNLALLRRIAEATGGLVVPPTGLETAVAQLDLDAEVSSTVRTRPVWNRWWVLLAVTAGLTVEWLIRKRMGLA